MQLRVRVCDLQYAEESLILSLTTRTSKQALKDEGSEGEAKREWIMKEGGGM